ncbi:NUDIX hydrolase [Taibaiella soli]|uniref:NUDIX hydrolase n=1 Tax=Taibaiella soli TaxID=1649169 RepID=A0A2W2AUK7_9BACT|nr:NUDIX domain-containing protein [Taibaiella soli]PZF71654.1 NUDIX hydrolase [Taibaiella soli]
MKSFSSYKNPALAIDLVVFGYHDDRLSVLLLNRKDEPFKDQWTLPGAFLQMEESFQDACDRVLGTKLGMNKVYMEQLFTFDDPARDPRGRVISVTYYALINPKKFEVVAGKMANDVQWFDVRKLPALGFDHKTIFKTAHQRLKSKILYYPVGFELLDETFTMPELHHLYECILETKIDRRNFSRKLLASEYIVETGSRREGQQNRPADLYKFNKKLKQNNFQLNIN